ARAVALSPDGARALVGRSDGQLELWDLASDRRVVELERGSEVHAVALAPDGRRALAGEESGRVRLLDVESGVTLRSFDRHRGKIASVAFTRDARRALSASEDGAVRIWDLESGDEADVLDLASAGDAPIALAVHPDGRSFFASTKRGVVLRFAFREERPDE